MRIYTVRATYTLRRLHNYTVLIVGGLYQIGLLKAYAHTVERRISMEMYARYVVDGMRHGSC